MVKRIVAEEEKSKLLLDFLTWLYDVQHLDICEFVGDETKQVYEQVLSEEFPQLIGQFLSKK